MKKLTTLLAAAALGALSMNAQVYLAGDFQGWNPESATEMSVASDGWYEATLQNVTAFKMSTARGNWDTFNAGGIGYNGTISGPGTYDIAAYGDNQTMPWTGTWTVRVNSAKTQMTLSTTTPKPTSTKIYLRGDMNSWGTTNQFTTTDDDLFVIENITINAGQGFKVADANWGAINYGGVSGMEADKVYTLQQNSQTNCTVKNSYTGKISFRLSTHQFVLGDFPTGPVVRDLYLVGDNYGNWSFDAATAKQFTREGNVYTIELPEGLSGSWKIWDGTWDYNFGRGADELVAGDNEVWFNSSSNFGLNTTENVKLTLTVVEGSDVAGSSIPSILNVVIGSDVGVSEIETVGEGEAVYYNFQGVRVQNPEKGMYIRVQNGKATKVCK